MKGKVSLATGLMVSMLVQAESQPLNQIYHVLDYSCYQAKEDTDNVVEYCTPVHTDSVENFNVPMGGYLTPEGRVDAAQKYAAQKNKALEKAEEPPKHAENKDNPEYGTVEYSQKYGESTMPVSVAASGGLGGSTATTSAGGDLRKRNPKHMLEKAEIAVKQAEKQYQVDLRRLESAKRDLVQLEARVEETRRVAEEAIKIAQANPTDRNNQKAREAEGVARYHQSRLSSLRMETYEKRVEASAKRLEDAQAKAEEARAVYESGETQ